MDNVNHPAHYCAHYKLEVIELTEKLSFCVGNAAKYILRAPFKGKQAEDYRKALWYVDRAWSKDEAIDERVYVPAHTVATLFKNAAVDHLLNAFNPYSAKSVRERCYKNLRQHLETLATESE